MVHFQVFPDSQVLRLVGPSVSPESQVLRLVGPSVFPDSQVLRMFGPSVFPDSRLENHVLRPKIDFSRLISSPKRLLIIF